MRNLRNFKRSVDKDKKKQSLSVKKTKQFKTKKEEFKV